MLIDFHTHIFPSKIAGSAIEALNEGTFSQQGYRITPCTDATRDGLLSSMERNGVDISVVMPVVTNPKQLMHVNEFATQIGNKKIVSFGGIHPMQENPEAVLKDLKRRGFKGIKLHPEFQHAYIDSPEYIKILISAEKLGLYTTIHAGKDIGMPPPVHCTPKRLKNALDYVSGKYIIAAHLGGYQMWDEVYDELAGTDIYMDTAFLSKFISKDIYLKIIRKHSSKKILFGSDSPWEDPKSTLDCLLSLGLTKEETEDICFSNALRLLSPEES